MQLAFSLISFATQRKTLTKNIVSIEKHGVESEGEIAFGPQSFEVWRQLRWLDKQKQNKTKHKKKHSWTKTKYICIYTYIYLLKYSVGAAGISLFQLLTAATLAYKLFFSWQNF